MRRALPAAFARKLATLPAAFARKLATLPAAFARKLATLAPFVLAVALLAACGSDSPPDTPTNWPVPQDATLAANRAGLPMLGQEMLEVHYHAHVEIQVRGAKVTVPKNLGIDQTRRTITALHTHDTTGVVHIESAADIPFTLGQFFTEWGQPLNPSQVGPVTAGSGEEVRVYVNGKQASGDPAAVKFVAHDEIVVWLGKSSEQPKVPSSYNFPEGL